MAIPKITFNYQDYEKIAKIGVGAFGNVYKCINNTTGQVVAVKILNLEEYDDNIAEVQQEISTLRKACESPHVVGIYGSFVVDTDLWIVMEYMNGGSILDLMKPGPIDEKYVAIIMREMLLGLDHLHKMNIIHRDIKAANVLMSHEGHIKLADFGVCGQLSATLTKRTSLVGTVSWMAPEVIQQLGYNTSVDIWSLGITAIEMAKGVPPYSGDDPLKVMFLIPRNEAPTLEGSFSKAFKDFIAQCLQKDPSKRLSAEELLKHKFIRSAKKGTTILTELIDRLESYKSTHNRTPISNNSSDASAKSTSSSESDESDKGSIKWVWSKESMRTVNGGTLRKKPSVNDADIQENDLSTDESQSDKESDLSEASESTMEHLTIKKANNPQDNDNSHSETSSDDNASVHREEDDTMSSNSMEVDSVLSDNGEMGKIDNIVIDNGLSGMPTTADNFLGHDEEEDQEITKWDFPSTKSLNTKSLEALQLVLLPAISKACESHAQSLSSFNQQGTGHEHSDQNSELVNHLSKIFQNLENELPGFSSSFLHAIEKHSNEPRVQRQDFGCQYMDKTIEEALNAHQRGPVSNPPPQSENSKLSLDHPNPDNTPSKPSPSSVNASRANSLSHDERELKTSLGSLFMSRWREKNFSV